MDDASVNLLLDAEKAWRGSAGMPKEKLAKAGTIYMRFQRWGAAFKGRLMTDRVAAKVSSLKEQEGADAPEPPPDGLKMPIDSAEKMRLRNSSCCLHWGWPWQLLLPRNGRQRRSSTGVLRRRWDPYLGQTLSGLTGRH